MGPTDQFSNHVPPRRGAVQVITVDPTARPYDLSGLDMNGGKVTGVQQQYVFLSLQAVGGDVFFYFSPATASDLDDTAATAAGGAVGYANTHAWKLVSGTTMRVRIERQKDKFLILKAVAAGSAKLILAATSEPL